MSGTSNPGDTTWLLGHASTSSGDTPVVSEVGTPPSLQGCASQWGHKPIGDTALKFDAGKVPFELLPAPALEAIAEVLAFGAKKYASWNWAKGFAWSRLLGATMRHLFAWARGEDRDPESGLSHLAHAGCCILFLITHERCKLGTDDRYKMEG